MTGLFSAPAVMRSPGLVSTAVRSIRAVGHRLDRTSRMTCCDASAVSRATEIWGLFLSATASASFTDKTVGVAELPCGVSAGGAGEAVVVAGSADTCGSGAEGRLSGGAPPDSNYEKVDPEKQLSWPDQPTLAAVEPKAGSAAAPHAIQPVRSCTRRAPAPNKFAVGFSSRFDLSTSWHRGLTPQATLPGVGSCAPFAACLP